jgi:hypothetical protein
MTQSRIVQFFEGAGRDDSGRLLADILKFDDDRLECVHDYIQWLFPLPEPSGANPLAPTLSEDVVAAFHARPELRTALRQGFLRLLAFYGFAYDGGTIALGAHFWKRRTVWLNRCNHNHLSWDSPYGSPFRVRVAESGRSRAVGWARSGFSGAASRA